MSELETLTFSLALACLGLALIAGVWRAIAGQTSSLATEGGTTVITVGNVRLPGYLTLGTTVLSLVLITVSLSARAFITGHGPFSNMYEFATAFSWGIVAAGLFFWWRYKVTVLSTFGTAIAIGLMVFAARQSSASTPLVPALQQSVLLTTHVASAVISYGAFTIGFAAAVMYLIRHHGKGPAEDREGDIMDEISYHTVMVGFPFITLVIILGALWADVAWGSYWSWDPKETASLVTWLLYAAYLHVRVMRGWRGSRASILLVIGFAAVVFTFFGNYVFSGLHQY
jgi:cytochrome c-type biogenesis protein CcsB